MTAKSAKASGAEPKLLPITGVLPSLRRIGALVERYVFLLRSSGARVAELLYWPFLQMLTWGLLQKYLAETATPLAFAAGVLIGSALLWDILLSSKIGFSTTFVEEIWARNLGNLLTSPLRLYEFVAALSVWSVIRVVVSMFPVTLAAYFIFGFDLLDLGLRVRRLLCRTLADELVPRAHLRGLHFALRRCGRGACLVACVHAHAILLRLLSGVGPPGLASAFALALPPTHVFEGMRSILLQNTFDPTQLWWALGLNAVYLFRGLCDVHLVSDQCAG